LNREAARLIDRSGKERDYRIPLRSELCAEQVEAAGQLPGKTQQQTHTGNVLRQTGKLPREIDLTDYPTSQALEASLVPSSSWSSDSLALAGRKKWLNTKTAAEGRIASELGGEGRKRWRRMPRREQW